MQRSTIRYHLLFAMLCLVGISGCTTEDVQRQTEPLRQTVAANAAQVAQTAAAELQVTAQAYIQSAAESAVQSIRETMEAQLKAQIDKVVPDVDSAVQSVRQTMEAKIGAGGVVPDVDSAMQSVRQTVEAQLGMGGTEVLLLTPRQEWEEPEGPAYWNFCGPGATKVALDIAGVPLDLIPDWKTISETEEFGIHIKNGVTIQSIVPALNGYLQTDLDITNAPYTTQNSVNADDLARMIRETLQAKYALITGVMTGKMPGWKKPDGTPRDVPHIVAVVGYEKRSDHSEWVSYVETAASDAGYTGTHAIQQVSLKDFWGFVSSTSGAVNVQAAVVTTP